MIKIYIKKFFCHIFLIFRHKWRVFINCCKCGLVWQGIVHDMSKFSPSELFESVKYYQGNRSPIGVCRRANGVSLAWLHHKGRNKRHIEYWLDGDCEVTPLMPYEYAVECVCDKLAATRTYAGKNYSPDMPLSHWERYGCKVNGNPKTMKFIEEVFADVKLYGEDYVLNKKYMKATYKKWS
ncbi:MAG: catalase [Clostridia bacterium]|nr:catalase [Clostridia bacterium]